MLPAMTFSVSKIAWLLIQPGTILLLALVGILALGRLGPRTRTALGIVTGALLAVALTPLSAWLLRPLDERFPPPTPQQVAAAPGIIVLGGAVRLTATAERPGVILSGTAERYVETLRIAHAHPNKKIAFTGGSGNPLRQDLSEGPIAEALFLGLGIAPERLVIEGKSRVTAESPARLAALLPEGAREQGWLLVTSAWHMPRTVAVFRADGWTVVPYPVDYRTLPEGGWAPGLIGGLGDLHYALHEWVGLIAYRLLGRTDTLFPAP